jgi:hypothetical protein
VKYFPNVPNLFINGDNFLDGFLGLRWFPSDDAKAKVAVYERQVADVLFGLWRRYTAGWVMYEIGCARPKTVQIMPPQFAPDFFPKDEINAYTGTVDNSWMTAQKAGQEGKTCMAEKKSDRVEAKGGGADLIITFDPCHWTAAGSQGPGSAADLILFHELVHAMRYVRGQGTMCFGAPPGFDGKYEEFIGVVIANILCSETNRPLRRDLEGFRPLPANLATSQAFVAKYGDYLKPLCDAHKHLYGALKKATGIAFNPFTLL